MDEKMKLICRASLSLLTLLVWSAAVMAKPEPSACVEKGALVWNDWTSTDAGQTWGRTV